MNPILPTKEQNAAPSQRFHPNWLAQRAAIGFVAAASACVLDLPDLPDGAGASGYSGILPPIGGSAGMGGSPGGSGGAPDDDAGVGGSSGGSSLNPCVSGQKLCDGTCRPFAVENGCGASACDPCPNLQNGSVGCSAAGQCILVSCNDGFADCDADAVLSDNLSTSNGCEYSFGSLANPAPPLEVPLKTMSVDGNMDDWAGIPAYPLREVCSESGCADPEFAPISAFQTLPLRKDLDAYFRVTWDATFFYLVVEAFDDDIYVDPGARADEKCRAPADCEESMTLFFDGFDERATSSSYGQSGRRIFLGLENGLFSKNDNPVGSEVGIAGQLNGPACYRIEAQVAWEFLVAQGGTPDGQFPAAVGNTYGFDLSLSDWDTDTLSTPEQVRRQSQVFWVNPGPDYRLTMGGFQELRLIDALPAQQ